MDMIATTFDIACPFEGWRLRSGDRTVTTKELQWSATLAERRTFERDFRAERMAGLVRGFPNIAVLPDRPPNRVRLSCGAELERSQTEDYLRNRGAGSFKRLLDGAVNTTAPG